ncbi:hypothetical protein EG329_013964 [Mollisiaceae sp. DMI_Dod_QoI]|nr:hypothetical protein EG329_013964 [Helotiales sp. DMI_Dod_QoI]
MNGVDLFLDLCEVMEPHMREESSKAVSGVKRCKSLAKFIKSQRSPPWPSPPTAILPTKDVADELVECYIRTTETIYRILHIPTFRRDYEALWESGTEPVSAFTVQLKLVLAIGATTYDEQFSLRASAIRWIYEAQTWLSHPNLKSQLTIQSLQTNTLLVLAQETVDVGGDSVWISTGALLRRAVHMGLHIDPARRPKMKTFAAEMRRRIWNTILEMALQSSMTSGGPPFLSLEDFDTEPPSNLDDDQLLAIDPMPKPEDEFSQMSIAIALRKTFPIRLAVAKLLNDISSPGTYEETLRLDAELRASYKTLCRNLQRCSSNSGPSPSQFEIRAVDVLMYRYISALHVPFFSPALHETAYAFSRKIVIEAALKIWYSVYPPLSITTAQPHSDAASSNRNDLARLTVAGSVFFRTVAMQATVLIAVELTAQLQEEESLGHIPLRPDLLSVVDDGKAWCLKCIEMGETNIKGYLLMCVVLTQIEGLMRGIGKDANPELLVKAAEEAEERCMPILENMAAQGRGEGTVDELHQMSLNTSPDVMQDWDFMMSETLFDPGNADPMSWMFNDEFRQGPSLW